MPTKKQKTCTYCHKPPSEVGMLFSYQLRTRAPRVRVCLRCRWLHGLVLQHKCSLVHTNQRLLRLNQPPLTIMELTREHNKPKQAPRTNILCRDKQLIERRQAWPRQRYYTTKAEAEHWIGLQYKKHQRGYMVVHYQGKGYGVV
jgi:hypothetical protein